MNFLSCNYPTTNFREINNNFVTFKKKVNIMFQLKKTEEQIPDIRGTQTKGI